MTVKSSIPLSDEHHAFTRAQVQDGRFAPVSAVVQHGLELLRQRAEDKRLDRAALKARRDERQAGAFVSAEQMRSELAPGKAAFWCTVDVGQRLIRILAVFFGAQDRQRRMLIRLPEPRR